MPTLAPFRTPRRPARLAVALAVSVLALALPAAAQESAVGAGIQPIAPLPPLTLPAVFTFAPIAAAAADTPASWPRLRVPPSPRRPAPLVPLYLSFAGLQSLDAITTLRALDDGHQERNPVVGWLAQHPGALVAAKAGVAAGTVYLSERLWKKNRTAAVVLMVALNGAYAAIIANNHGTGR